MFNTLVCATDFEIVPWWFRSIMLEKTLVIDFTNRSPRKDTHPDICGKSGCKLHTKTAQPLTSQYVGLLRLL